MQEASNKIIPTGITRRALLCSSISAPLCRSLFLWWIISTVNPDPLKCSDFGRQSVARNLADFGENNFAFVKQLHGRHPLVDERQLCDVHKLLACGVLQWHALAPGLMGTPLSGLITL